MVYLIPSALNETFLRHHPNLTEVAALCAELQRRGYSIDAFDYRSRRAITGYDLILGFGEAVYRAQLGGEKNVVLYATGASANFQHRSVEAVLGSLCERFGPEAVKYVRIPERYLGISEALSNQILSIGSSWTASTFVQPSRVHSLPGIVAGRHADADDIVRAANRRGSDIAWIGSKGVLHKGLHTAAEVAAKLGVKLHAVGIKDEERAFSNKLLQGLQCDHAIYPFVTPGDATWTSVVEKCRLVVGASLSEGMSTSILTAARSGLYPISTEACGVPLGDTVAADVEKIAGAADRVLSLPASGFQAALEPILRRVCSENTAEAFAVRLRETLSAMESIL